MHIATGSRLLLRAVAITIRHPLVPYRPPATVSTARSGHFFTMPETTHYTLLGVPEDATAEQGMCLPAQRSSYGIPRDCADVSKYAKPTGGKQRRITLTSDWETRALPSDSRHWAVSFFQHVRVSGQGLDSVGADGCRSLHVPERPRSARGLRCSTGDSATISRCPGRNSAGH